MAHFVGVYTKSAKSSLMLVTLVMKGLKFEKATFASLPRLIEAEVTNIPVA